MRARALAIVILFGATLLFSTAATAASLTVCNETNEFAHMIVKPPSPGQFSNEAKVVAPQTCAAFVDIFRGQYVVDFFTTVHCKIYFTLRDEATFRIDDQKLKSCARDGTWSDHPSPGA
jgi:hypothetical protein